MNTSADLITHKGGCHCGRVRFEVDAPAELEAQLCNCSICSMTAYLHLIVPASRFHLVLGAQDLTTYTFNTEVAQHRFCIHCGIKLLPILSVLMKTATTSPLGENPIENKADHSLAS